MASSSIMSSHPFHPSRPERLKPAHSCVRVDPTSCSLRLPDAQTVEPQTARGRFSGAIAGMTLTGFHVETWNHILRTTRTTTGLRVRARLVGRTYKTGVKVTDAQMEQLRITSDSPLPKWNYTIEPM